MLVGEVETARELVDDALASDVDLVDRLELLGLRARLAILLGDGPRLLPALHAAVDEGESSLPEQAGVLLTETVIVRLYAGGAASGSRPGAVALAERARSLTQNADRAVRARADTALGLAHAFEGDRERARAELTRGADLVRVGGAPHDVAHLLQQVVVGLASLEQYDDALSLSRRYVRSVRSVGADGLLPLVLCYLANSAYFTGDFDEMEMAAVEAVGLAEGSGQPALAAYGRECHGLVLGLRGESGAAVRELEAGIRGLAEHGAGVIRMLGLLGLGLNELSRGEWEAAAQRYEELVDFMVGAPVVPGLLHWRADRVEALWRAGREGEARQALAELRAGIDDSVWERAGCARMTALLATDPVVAGHAFEEALELHTRGSSPFERARSELCLGEWLVEHERYDEARVHLEAAASTFARLGVRPWTERARSRIGLVPIDERNRSSKAHASLTASVWASASAEVRAFGPLTVVAQGVETRVGMDNPGRVLRCLASARGPLHAEQIIDTIWPDASPETGGARLRTVLSRVRSSYGPVVVREGAVLRWSDHVDVDVQRFRELTDRAMRLREGPEAAAVAELAVSLYRDELLPLDRYADDVAAARERMRYRYLGMLELLAEHELATGRPQAAAARLRTAIEADPLDELRYVRLADLLLDEGRRSEAQTILRRGVEALDVLGLPPSPRLLEVQRRVTRGDSR